MFNVIFKLYAATFVPFFAEKVFFAIFQQMSTRYLGRSPFFGGLVSAHLTPEVG
jgi:hypothetical protein